jgi:hypothetical protein
MNLLGQTMGGPGMATSTFAGSVAFQRDDGKFVIIGGGTYNSTSIAPDTRVSVYDAGWVDKGIYKSEQFDLGPVGTKLTTNSTLVWKANTAVGIAAEVRTAPSQAGLQTASWREIPYSGAPINPLPTDTWLQINFNFKRTFPGTGKEIMKDVWYNGGSYNIYNYPQITLPTIYEYKVTQDKDILNLQADALTLFRVSSGGDIYSSLTGAFNTGGADLAERYTSEDVLEPGDVVAIDNVNSHAVRRTSFQYQSDILGVVSTDPGFVGGAYTENSYPIALIGRVPVKVSTENGPIRLGDYLTSASIAGYAMKADLAGRVLGRALEPLKAEEMVDCPASDVIIPGRKCGKIMMFVNLINYLGEPISLVMEDWQTINAGQDAIQSDLGLEFMDTLQALVTDDRIKKIIGAAPVSTQEDKILAFLEKFKKEKDSRSTSLSEVFADRVTAISQIISPEIYAELVNAKIIRGLVMESEYLRTKILAADAIEINSGGFLNFVLAPDGKLVIKARSAALADVSASSSPEILGTSTEFDLASSSPDVSSSTPEVAPRSEDGLDVITFDTSGNGVFMGEVLAQSVKTKALTVSGRTTLQGLIVESIGTSDTGAALSILSDVNFFGRPYFNSDTAGFVRIAKDQRRAEILFDKEYLEEPVVNATMGLATTTPDKKIDENILFADDIRFIIIGQSTKGFTILLNKLAPADMSFGWIALAVKNPKIFNSVEEPKIVTPPDSEIISPATSSAPTVTENPKPVNSGTQEVLPALPENQPVSINATTTGTSLEEPSVPAGLPSEVPNIAESTSSESVINPDVTVDQTPATSSEPAAVTP